jgi:hypothetical protein
MKTIDFSPISCGEGYETPAVQLNDIQPEGLLCQSGQFEEWNEETLEW